MEVSWVFFNCCTYTQGGLGIFGFVPANINPKTGMDMGFYGAIIAILAAMTCGFVLTWLFGYKNTNTVKEVKENENIDKENLIKQEIYVTPVQGEVVSLKSVDDPVFASGTIGKGIAIKPSEEKFMHLVMELQ